MNDQTTNAKPEFTLRTLKAWEDRINQAFPAELERDWRHYVRDSFRLTPDQERSLGTIAPDRDREIQGHFVEAAHQIRHGGKLHLRVTARPHAEQTASAVHDLHFELTPGEPPKHGEVKTMLTIVIAHCDAHCRNWGWGPG